MLDDPQPQQPAIDPDLLSAGYAPPLRKIVRGADKLNGVQPDLLNHWNNLQGEFDKAGLQPEIKSGYRTTQQQQSLFNNPATRARTKGNDGIVNISPHQEGRALDISFPSTQKAKGHQIIADYAKRNGLHVPSDEPWHIALPKATPTIDPDLLNAGFGQEPAKVEAPNPLAGTLGTYVRPPNTPDGIDSDLLAAGMGQEQSVPMARGRGAGMARAQGTTYPVRQRAQPQQGWGGKGTIGQGVPDVSVNAMGGPQPSNGVGGLRQIDDPETARILRAQRQVTAEQTPAERQMQRAPGTADARLLDPKLTENEEVLRRVAQQKDQEDQIAKQTAWEQANKPEIDSQVAQYRKDIQSSGMTKWLTELQGKGAAQLAEFGAGVAKTAGAQGAANTLRIRAVAAAQAAQEESKDRGQASKLAQDILGGFAGSAPELLLMQAGIPPVATFAAGGGLRAAGMGQPVVPAMTQGALTGATFELPAEATGVRGTLARAGKVGVGTVGVDLATGQPVSQALKSGAINAAMVGVPGLVGEGLPKGETNEANQSGQERGVLDKTLAPVEATPGSIPGEQSASDGLAGQRDLAGQGNETQGEQRPDTLPVRHVDLQARYKIGDRAGDFKKETKAQAEERRAQVAQASQPAQAVTTPPEAATSAMPVEAAPKDTALSPEIVKPWEMSRDQIEEEFQRKKAEDDNLEASILGPDLAKRYAQLQRSANSSYDTEKANRASDEIEKIESSLSERDRNRLYGIGEEGPQLEDLRAYKQSLGNLDDSDPQSLAESMRWAVSRVGNETDPTRMTHEQQVAYGTLREAARLAYQHGWDTQAISREAVKAAAGRFADPEDAAFMLDRFLKKEPASTVPQRKQITAQPEGVTTALSQPSVESAPPTDRVVEPVQPVASAEPPKREAGEIPKTTGIAHRVETAARGEEPSRGQGIGAQESVERGRQLLREGRDPQQVIDDFQKSGAISAESMAVVRARHEELAQAANRAFDVGRQNLNSPEFKTAEKARQDFYDNAVKPMQTAWSNTGRAQQGETDIDTGTFYGMYRAFKDSKAREPSPREVVTIKNLAERNAAAESSVKNLGSQLAAELDKAAGIKDLPDEVQKSLSRFIDQAKRESRRTGRQTTRKALDDEAVVIKQNLAAAFQKVKSQTGIQPSGLARLDPEGEITKQVIALAKNRVKAGVTDAAQLVDDVHGAIRDFADVTKREVSEAILGQGAPKDKKTESEWAKTRKSVAETLKAQDVEVARRSLGVRLQKGKVSTEDASAVWKYARENYVDQGNSDFADIRAKVASDLGIDPETVTRALANTKAAKRISDEMWAKMSDRRQLRTNAESWIRQADSPSYVKAFENLRRLWFLKATVGHGAVAPFTHAPANAFIPSRWADFWRGFGKTYQFMVSKGGHERSMVDLENSPNYTTAQRAGLANDPKRGYDEYQSPWMGKMMGKLGVSGNRAFDSLKTMRQDMFDSVWKGMTNDLKTPETAKALSQEINASTGASKALSGQDWPSRFVSKAMFAAPLEASRWDFLVRDNYRAMKAFTNWKDARPEERYMAKRVASRNAQLVATYGSLLAANQGLLIATGSKDKVNVTDPTKSDFLAFKIGGKVISPAGGMLTALRFVGNLMHIGLEDKKAREKISDAASTTFKYGRSKLSPLFGTGADIWLQSDYSGRPLPFSKQEGTEKLPRYTWSEYGMSTQTPIPIAEAARTYYAEREKGASKGGAFAKSLPIGAVAATGIRVREDFQSQPNAHDARTAAVDQMRNGDISPDSELRSQGFTPTQIKGMKNDAKLNSFQVAFSNAPAEQSLYRFERMDERQRFQVQKQMEHKAFALTTRADYLLNNARPEDKGKREQERDALQQRLDTLKITPRDPKEDRPSANPFKIGSGAFKVPAFK